MSTVFSRQSNDTLYIINLFIVRETENSNISALWILKVIGKPGPDDAVTRHDGIFHRNRSAPHCWQ